MTQPITIQYLPVARLLAYPGNPRIHSKVQIRQIANSIRSFGFLNPIVVDANDQIVAGHGRALAARDLGLNTVPCIRVEHLSNSQRRAYLLADNKITENAVWNPELLRIELDHLATINFDIELTGFSTPEIDLILNGDDSSLPEPSPPPLPSREDTITQMGNIWQLGPHRVICGDSRDRIVIEQLMAGDQARMVFTDPSYNVRIEGHARGLGKDHHGEFVMASGELSSEEFTQFLQESLGQLAEVSQNGSLHYICMDWRHLRELLAAGDSVYSELINFCVWNKTNGGMGSLYRSKHELILVYKKGAVPHINNVELGKHGRYRANVWDYPGVNAFGVGREKALALHPTVKPIRLVADAILDATKRGEIVLDGFTGSGSTLLAAQQTDRVFRGVELDPRYVDVTIRRWAEMTGQEAVLIK